MAPPILLLEAQPGGARSPVPISPLLTGHLHHVIARDDGGPPHPLNLVGLCSNHHAVLERVRRQVAPHEARSGERWFVRAQAALEVAKTLPDPMQSLFFVLSDPHPLRQPIRDGVDIPLQSALARDVARADAKLLLAANLARPRALWISRMAHERRSTAESGTLSELERVRQTASPYDVADVIKWHLQSLSLPFDQTWLEDTPRARGVPSEILR